MYWLRFLLGPLMAEAGGVLGGDGSGDGGGGKGAGDGKGGAGDGKGGTGDGGGGGGNGNASPVAWLTGALDEKGEFKAGWTDNLPDGLKAAKETLSRYKSPEAALFGLHNANVKLGSKVDAITVPTDKSTKEEIAAFRKALNVPDDIKGYGIKKPDQLPDGVVWDEKRLERYLPIFHKHNLSKAAVEELLSMNMQDQAALSKMEDEMGQAFVGQQIAELKTEWGDKFAGNKAKCLAIMPHLGMKPDDPALSHASVARMLLKAHQLLSAEDSRLEGKILTTDEPGAEADRIQGDKAHPLYEAYRDASHPRHAEAVTTLRTLRQQSEAAKKRG